MMTDFVLNAEKRDEQGKGASRRLRRAGMVPAIIYGAGKEPATISLNHNEVIRQLENEAFYSHILTLKIGGTEEQAILRDMQRHPSKPYVTHMDFQRVSATDKIRVLVPVHFINEDTCVGVKQGGGVLNHLMTEVEVQCLPKDLPEFIEVDVAGLNVGDTIHLSNLKLGKGVEIVELLHGDEHDNAVVACHKGHGGAAAAETEEGEEAAAEEGGE
ncbi:MAG: 50S ribosomal protein L25/general stress protein Ctc [Gammaproteobacteria bacterium]|nr:50S ribosomal protein L25/general stress protein Ctc [Chromatiales bacterium]MDX5334164.1 50S ribosomal protein L25/general stress protein Ctc [Gammaproteobacteria bacterium]MDX5375656.1 50S ribosomal protein L25/general stress protein Ctc [Gammaproteobacteria bacterium]